MKKLLLPFFLFAVFTFASCASIVSRSIYNVRLNSSPTAAYVQVFDRNGREVFNGTTPTEVELKSGAGYFRRAEYTVKYTKEGYQPKEITLFADINGWYFGNFIFGGLIGFLIVDPATGAMYRIEETDLNETLVLASQDKVTGTTGSGTSANTASANAPASKEKTLHIIELQQVPEHLRKNLVQIQ